MDLELTPEQKLIRDTPPGLRTNEIAKVAAQIDREHRFPREIVVKLGELGMLGVAGPERWGGDGRHNLRHGLAVEEISRGCASTGVIMSVQNSLVCDPILHFG